MGHTTSREFFRKASRLWLGALLVTWALGAGTGYWLMVAYEKTPGKGAAMVQKDWPAEGTLELGTGKVTVVIAAHPGCPCSRASLAEIAELVAKHPGKIQGYVLFVTQPKGGIGEKECRESALWKQATDIAGVTCVVDDSHVATALFHARTSGQVLVYDENGKLQFSGGITAARDHAGPSAGSDSIAAILEGGTAMAATTPVFGCALE